jgi:putative SOS response-associated peptidase YedK
LGELFALAGLWDEWTSPDRVIIESCTILTTSANSLVGEIMHDRMLVIVPADKYDLWLDPDVNDFEAIPDILKAFEANRMADIHSAGNSTIQGTTTLRQRPITLGSATRDHLF